MLHKIGAQGAHTGAQDTCLRRLQDKQFAEFGVHVDAEEMRTEAGMSVAPCVTAGLPMMSNGQPILGTVSTWEEARRGLLNCATARALAGALLRHQEACCDVWQVLWSQCCGGGCVPSRSVLSLRC